MFMQINKRFHFVKSRKLLFFHNKSVVLILSKIKRNGTLVQLF